MEYEEFVKEFSANHDDPVVVACGLTSEAGEVAGIFEKWYRGSYGDKSIEQLEDDVLKELGDTLFFLTWLANLYDFDLKDIQNANMRKLRERRSQGTIAKLDR